MNVRLEVGEKVTVKSIDGKEYVIVRLPDRSDGFKRYSFKAVIK